MLFTNFYNLRGFGVVVDEAAGTVKILVPKSKMVWNYEQSLINFFLLFPDL